MRLLLVVVVVCASAGCVNDHLVACGDDLLCPAGTRCDTVHGSCATQDQFAACEGRVDGDACTANSLDGFCDHGVCIRPGCGNRVVEMNEVCDDGNTTSGDGCSADCTSKEGCGNGVVDTVLGETCDDGNLATRDGCDDACHVEPLSFDVVGIAPTRGRPGWSTYDKGKNEILHFDSGILWSYKDDVWSIVSTTGPSNLLWWQLIYDPGLDRDVVIGVEPSQTVSIFQDHSIVVYDWDGAQWKVRAVVGKALATGDVPAAAVYDAKLASLFVVGRSSTGPIAYLLTAGQWVTQSAVFPLARATIDGYVAAYNPASNHVLVGCWRNGQAPETVDFDGTAFTAFPGALPGGITTGYAFGFDSSRNAVVAIGGPSPGSKAMATWNATTNAWAPQLGVYPQPRTNLEITSQTTGAYDGFTFGGTSDVDQDTAFIRSGASYAAVKQTWPPNPTTDAPFKYAYDEALHRLIASSVVDTWSWDGAAWTDLAFPLPGTDTSVRPLVFDPTRGVVIAVSAQSTYALSPSSWSTVASGFAATTVTFDGTELVATSNATTSQLASTAPAWVTIGAMTPALVTPTLAYDERDHELVLINAIGGATYVLDPTSTSPSWQPTISPGPQTYRVVADRRRRTAWFISPQGPMWERIDGNFTMQPSLPLAVDGPSVYTDAGELMTIGTIAGGRVILIRRFGT